MASKGKVKCKKNFALVTFVESLSVTQATSKFTWNNTQSMLAVW